MIFAYPTFPPGSTEVLQRGPLGMLPDAIRYVKEERWACFIVRASLLYVWFGVGCWGHTSSPSLFAVNTPVRNVLGKGSQALAFLLCQQKCKAVLKVHGSCSPNPSLLISIRL